MKLNSPNVNERIAASNVFFENALGDPEMLSGFVSHGYPAEKLSEGKAILETLQQKQISKNTARAVKRAATKTIWSTRKTAHKAFMRLVKFARVAFKTDAETLEKLSVHKRIPTKYADWLLTVEQFYTILLADEATRDKLIEFGVTLEDIEAGHQLVRDTKEAVNTREQQRGKSQQATKERDIELHKLDDFIRGCVSIAKLAFEDKPQYLERLGIVER